MIKLVRYRPSGLALRALGLSSLALFAAYLAWTDVLVIAWLLALAAGYGAFCHVRAAVLDRPALTISESGLTINTLYRAITVRWDQVQDVHVELLAPPYMNMLPLPRREVLTFALVGRAPGPISCKLPGKLLDLSGSSLSDLHMHLKERLGVRSAPAGPQQAADQGDDGSFDPDAAIARYLARRTSAPARLAPVLPKTAPDPYGRPVFGRRRS